MKRIIVGDSSCDLRPIYFKDENNFEFKVAPLTMNGPNNSQFVDSDDKDAMELISMVRTEKGRWSSACPSPESFYSSFIEGDEVYAVTITSKLSGTYNSALNAKKLVQEKYPEKKIHVIDSLAAGAGLALIIFKLQEFINSGKYTFEQICEKIDKIRDEASLLFVIRSFDMLVSAGRMKKIAGMIVSALNICPVCFADKGEIKIMEKVRGTGNAIRKMVNKIGEMIDTDGKTLVISHCNNLKDAEFIKELSAQLYKFKDIIILKMNGLASFYAGDQGIIIAF